MVESSMSFGSSHWCRSTPVAEHRSIPLEMYVGTERITRHSEFANRHLHPPIPYWVKTDDINRHQHDGINRQQQASTNQQQQTSSNRHPPMTWRVLLPSIDPHRFNATRYHFRHQQSQQWTPISNLQMHQNKSNRLQLISHSFSVSIYDTHPVSIDTLWTNMNFSWISRQRKKKFREENII